MGRQGAKNRIFVFPDEATVAEYLGPEYGDELRFNPRSILERYSGQTSLAQITTKAIKFKDFALQTSGREK